MNFLDERVPDNVWDKLLPCPMSGCWLWSAHANHHGYGVLRSGQRTQLAHRFLYQRLVGDVPPGLQLDHRCRVRCCCNPSHLEAVTGAENTRRGDSGQNMREKTHCPAGHEYAGDNLFLVRSANKWKGARRCRRCTNEKKRERRARAQGAA